jgi:hypothetical protein
MGPTCRRNYRGGGAGGAWGFTAAPNDFKLINNGFAGGQVGNCQAATRPGFLDGYKGQGLPGMSGGKRSVSRKEKAKAKKKNTKKSKKGKKTNRTYKQKGGRYGFDTQSLPGGTPWGTSYSPVTQIPCEASRTDVPDSGAAGSLNRAGGYLWDAPKSGGGAESASPFEIVPTAGYTQLSAQGADSIRTAAGTNLMINIPAGGRMMNPACLTTGGGKKTKKVNNGRKNSKKASKKAKKAKGRKH